LVSELRLTAGCVLMDLASPAVSQTSVYANGLKLIFSINSINMVVLLQISEVGKTLILFTVMP